MIGHLSRNGDLGYDAVAELTFAAGPEYDLRVMLKGTTVSVAIGVEDSTGTMVYNEVVGHVFNSVVVDGDFGLLTVDGSSSFDALTIRTDDPAATSHFSVAAPTVIATERNGGGQNFNELVTLAFTFSKDVSASLDKLDLTLVNDSTATPVDLAPVAEPIWDAGTNTATWNFTGAVIDFGFHTATLGAAGITDSAGDPLDGDGDGTGGDDFVVTEVNGKPLLVAIPGDLDLDGAVTVDIPQPFPLPALPGDAQLLLPNIGISSGALWADGDFDGDGAVTVNIPQPFPNSPLPGDAQILLANLGMSVVVSTPDAAALFADSSSPSESLMTSVEDVSRPLRGERVYEPERAAMLNVDPRPMELRPRRKASTEEVDLAIRLVTDDRVDRGEHDRLAVDRHAGRLGAAWDDALLAVVEDRQDR